MLGRIGVILLETFWKIILNNKSSNWSEINKKQDAYLEKAKSELEDKISASPRDISTFTWFYDWWAKWYWDTGHRKLGRLLLSKSTKKLEDNTVTTSRNDSPGNLVRPLSLDTTSILNDSDGYVFITQDLGDTRFFSYIDLGDTTQIRINTDHSLYSSIKTALIVMGIDLESQTSYTIVELSNLSNKFSNTPSCFILLMIISWVLLEKSIPVGNYLENLLIFIF